MSCDTKVTQKPQSRERPNKNFLSLPISPSVSRPGCEFQPDKILRVFGVAGILPLPLKPRVIMILFRIHLCCNLRLLMIACALGLVMGSSPVMAAQSKKSEGDAYSRARALALKDPKVRAAFDRANEELNRKILEIDPSLGAKVGRSRFESPRHLLPSRTATEQTARSTTHVVASGETLTSIAMENKISVARLARANHLSNNSRLRVGERLTIPYAKTTEASQREQSIWDKVRNAF